MSVRVPAYVHRPQLRWGDMDQLGHLNNVVYVDLFQQARALWWMETPETAGLLGPNSGPDGPVGTVVAELQIEWRRPIVFGQDVEVRLGTTGVGAARFWIWYEIWADGELACLGRTLMATVALNTGRVQRIASQVRTYLADVASDPEPLRPLRREPMPDTFHAFMGETRWSDADAYGHINNAQYLELFQEARIAMLVDMGGIDEVPVVAARADVRYRRQAAFRLEPHAIHTGICRVGTSSFDTAFRMLDDADDPTSVVSDGWMTLVHIDADGRPAPLAQVTSLAGAAQVLQSP